MLIKIKDLYEQLFSRAISGDDVHTKLEHQTYTGGSESNAERRSKVSNEQGSIKEEVK